MRPCPSSNRWQRLQRRCLSTRSRHSCPSGYSASPSQWWIAKALLCGYGEAQGGRRRSSGGGEQMASKKHYLLRRPLLTSKAKEFAPSMRDCGHISKSNCTRGSHGGQPSPATPPTTHGNIGTTIMAPEKSCLNGQIQSKRPPVGPTYVSRPIHRSTLHATACQMTQSP